LTGTLINVATVLAGSAVGLLLGARLPAGLQERVLAGLGLVTIVLGLDSALDYAGTDELEPTSFLFVLGGILLGGMAGEALRIEDRLQAVGDLLQRRFARGDPAAGGSRISEGFFTATLLFCVGPLTVLGSIDDGLRGDIDLLTTKSVLDGFASVALAAGLGFGVALSALSVLVIQGAITLGAGLVEDVLVGEPLTALTSAGGILIVAIGLKLAGIVDVKVGNFLPALVFAPALALAFG
jgi:hypothetical protein